MDLKKVIFIPVSSPEGIGEYMRSMVIANALQQCRTDIDIQFVLNRNAPYASQCPFSAHLLANSATKETKAVAAILQAEKPDVVVFDCSGRASQVKLAAKLGAKVIFISQHRKKRAKGFSWTRLRYLSEHWITQFQFVDGGISWIERLKLKLSGGSAPLFVGPVFSAPQTTVPQSWSTLPSNQYWVFAAGGGGHVIAGQPATEVFYQAALQIATEQNPALIVTGMNYHGQLASTDSVTVVKSLNNAELMTLVNNAKALVCGAGDLMGQAIVLGKPIVAVAVAKDQPARLAACANKQLVVAALPEATDIVTKIRQLPDTKFSCYQAESGLSIVLNRLQSLLG